MRSYQLADPQYWKPKQAANYLSISVVTLYNWILPKKDRYQNSTLSGPPPPFLRFNRNCIRFPVDEFIQWANTYHANGKDSKDA